MLASIYRDADGSDCSNGGISGRVKQVVIVDVPGPFEPTKDAPAVRLVVRKLGKHNYVHAEPVEGPGDGVGPMFGGAFIHTSDSRFGETVAKLSGYGHGFPVALHDRWESQELYNAMSH
jgi:hypothetical protein